MTNRLREELVRRYENFVERTEDHVITVIKNDGLYRHLRVNKPGTRMWGWDIVTWPGYLTVVGDVADGYTFSRVTDMLDFFRCSGRSWTVPTKDGEIKPPSIDYRYWAEKVQGRTRNELREVDHGAFYASVVDELTCDGAPLSDEAISEMKEREDLPREERMAAADWMARTRGEILSDARAFHGEYTNNAFEFYQWLQDYEVDVPEDIEDLLDITTSAGIWNVFEDEFYELNVTNWTYDFQIACWAIELTVRLWDALPEEEKASDSFVVVEGGIVQNDPSVPVFDLDVLESDNFTSHELYEAEELLDRMLAHPQRQRVRSWAEPVAEFLKRHMDEEQAEAVRSKMERHGRAE